MFDLLGTVFSLGGVDRGAIKAYLDHIRKSEWSPLALPACWEKLPPYPDSRRGLCLLRSKYTVVTCSNVPLGLTIKMCKYNGITFDGIMPLEMKRVYKTDPAAYLLACEVLGVDPEYVMMVTANETFGDLEAARALGMKAMLIRGNSPVEDIVALAMDLGC